MSVSRVEFLVPFRGTTEKRTASSVQNSEPVYPPTLFRVGGERYYITISCDTLAHPQQVSENMPRLLCRRYLPLDLLEDTGMTGEPHRPSSTDGHSSVSLLISIVLRLSILAGWRRDYIRYS
jgi:hypothetical protein